MNNSVISRRRFLKGAGAAALSFPYFVRSSALGQPATVAPSNRIVLGCIGMGGQGTGNMRGFLGKNQVQVVAVCDVDKKHRDRAKKFVDDKYKNSDCKTYIDFRELIARDDIDAVLVVTPDHWHALPAIAAAKAGKDIFLQKPLTLTIREGRVLSDTVRRYGRVFQVGSQQRSDTRFRQACELVRNGRIGELKTVKVGFGTDPGTGVEPPMPVPCAPSA